jgi:hypothetical protein
MLRLQGNRTRSRIKIWNAYISYMSFLSSLREHSISSLTKYISITFTLAAPDSIQF